MELTRWAQSRTLPVGDVFRARLILALAGGQTYQQIKDSLQTTAPMISRWKQRFEQQGMDGLGPTPQRQPTARRRCGVAGSHRAQDAAEAR